MSALADNLYEAEADMDAVAEELWTLPWWAGVRRWRLTNLLERLENPPPPAGHHRVVAPPAFEFALADDLADERMSHASHARLIWEYDPAALWYHAANRVPR